MSLEKILIVEDEPVIRSLLQSIFIRHKLNVTCASTLAEAAASVQREAFDLMILDIRLPDGDGHKFLEQIAAMPERPLVVMVTGYGTIESAVACMRAGAFDYVLKPFAPSQIDVILRKAQAYRQLLSVNRLLTDDPKDGDSVLVGRSPSMLRLRQLIDRVAPTDATVLVTGESGYTDAKRLFKKVATGQITEKQFLDCISVKRAEAKKLLGEIELNKMTVFTPSSPRLNIKRKKGAEVSLIEALKGINAALA